MLYLPASGKILFIEWLLKEFGEGDKLKDAERTLGRNNRLVERPLWTLKLSILLLGLALIVVEDETERCCNDDNKASSVLWFRFIDKSLEEQRSKLWIVRGVLRRRIAVLFVSDESKSESQVSFLLSVLLILCLISAWGDDWSDAEHDRVLAAFSWDVVKLAADNGEMMHILFRVSDFTDDDDDDEHGLLTAFGVNNRRKNEPNWAIGSFVRWENSKRVCAQLPSLLFLSSSVIFVYRNDHVKIK